MSKERHLDAFSDADAGKLRRQGIQVLLRPVVNLKGRLTKQELLSAYLVSARAKLHAADFLLPISLGMWALGVSRTNVTMLGPYGLPTLLPVVFYAGIALFVVSAAVELARNQPSARRMSLHAAALVIMLYGTAPIVYSQGRYSWLYKTVGIVQYVDAHGQLNRSIDIYQNWPGFFAFAASFKGVAGAASPLAYAKWSQLVFELAALPLLYLAYDALSLTVRQRWVALLLYSASNYIGQDYFSPQALGTVLSLGIMAMALRWLYVGDSSEDRRADQMPHAGWAGQGFPSQSPHSRRPWLIWATIVLLYFVLTFTHELSPYLVALQLGGLAVARLLRPRWLPIFLAVIALGYLAPRFTFVNHEYGLLKSAGSFFRNLRPPSSAAGGQVSGSQQLIEHCELALSVGMWGLALAGAWLRRRSGRAVLALVILAFSPFIALAAQAYGNEGVLRVYLFSLPWTAALAALALAPSPSQSGQPSSKAIRLAVGPADRRIGLTLGALRVPLALGVALILFFPAFFGNDSFNVMPQTEVATLASFQQTAAAGPIYTIEGNDPLSDTARYDQFPVSAIFHSTSSADKTPVTRDIANMITYDALKYTGGKQPAYVVITPSDIAISQAYGLTSLSNIRILTDSLAHSPDWKLVADQAGTVIYRLLPTARIPSNLPPSEPATTPDYPYVPLPGGAVECYPDLGLSVPRVKPVVHQPRSEPVLGRELHQRFSPVVEVFVIYLVISIMTIVESEIEKGSRSHDAAYVGKALLNDFDRAVGEHTVRVYHVEVLRRQKRKGEVFCDCKPRHLVLQLVFRKYLLRRKQHVGRDIDAAVIARVQVADEEPACPQVAAADFQHPAGGN